MTQAQSLLHGDETGVFGDAGYQGVEKRAENLELPVRWHIALKRGQRKDPWAAKWLIDNLE